MLHRTARAQFDLTAKYHPTSRAAARLASGLHMFAGDGESCLETLGAAAMNIKRILFPTDFSEYSSAALDYASSMASDNGALLVIVLVDESAGLSELSIPIIVRP